MDLHLQLVDDLLICRNVFKQVAELVHQKLTIEIVFMKVYKALLLHLT